MGSGWQAILAARMIEGGIDRSALVERMTKLRSEIIGFAALETVKYVARSGRVSNLQAGIGELLQVKPILELWDGNAAVCARVRGRKKSMQEVIERTRKFYDGRPLHAGVVHANALAEAEQLLQEARQALNFVEYYYSDIGPAIAALAGPGVVGLIACPADV
jgi:DegV family protein with EDD domain